MCVHNMTIAHTHKTAVENPHSFETIRNGSIEMWLKTARRWQLTKKKSDPARNLLYKTFAVLFLFTLFFSSSLFSLWLFVCDPKITFLYGRARSVLYYRKSVRFAMHERGLFYVLKWMWYIFLNHSHRIFGVSPFERAISFRWRATSTTHDIRIKRKPSLSPSFAIYFSSSLHHTHMIETPTTNAHLIIKNCFASDQKITSLLLVYTT